MEGIGQAILGSSDQWEVPASLSLFLKSEKIPALLYLGKGPEYRPFSIVDLLPQPTGLGHRSQITEGPILRPFSHTQQPTTNCMDKVHFTAYLFISAKWGRVSKIATKWGFKPFPGLWMTSSVQKCFSDTYNWLLCKFSALS